MNSILRAMIFFENCLAAPIFNKLSAPLSHFKKAIIGNPKWHLPFRRLISKSYFMKELTSPLPRTVAEYREKALSLMDPAARAYLECGSGEEVTLLENELSYNQWWIRPRILMEGFPPSPMDLSLETIVMGEKLAMPIMVAPSAAHTWYHPEGELASVKGVEKAKTLFIASSSASHTLEDIAAKTKAPLWFQLYVYAKRELSQEMMKRAENSGYRALVLTVDTPLYGPKESFSFHYKHPSHIRKANHAAYPPGSDQVIPLTWKDLDWIRSHTSLPIILKGVSCAEDAIKALEHGIQAIIISNHGGRQLDSALPTLEALPEVAKAVKGRMEIYLDGGIRQGSDIFKAIALGAKAILIGRPIHYGLTVNGAEGVNHILQILKEELITTMTLAGTPRLEDIKESSIQRKTWR